MRPIFTARRFSTTGHFLAGVFECLPLGGRETGDAVAGDLIEDWIDLAGDEFGIGQRLRALGDRFGTEGRFEDPTRGRRRGRARPALQPPLVPPFGQPIPQSFSAVVSDLDPEPSEEQAPEVGGMGHAVRDGTRVKNSATPTER